MGEHTQREKKCIETPPPPWYDWTTDVELLLLSFAHAIYACMNYDLLASDRRSFIGEHAQNRVICQTDRSTLCSVKRTMRKVQIKAADCLQMVQ